MKKGVLAIILLIISCGKGYGQCIGDPFDFIYNFDNSIVDYNCFIRKDSTDTVNVWEVGIPSKSVFDTAFSPINVIVTDKINTYKTNDTSWFMFAKRPGTASSDWGWHKFDGMYYVNSDTISDYGKMEYSPNNGITWIDLFKDTSGLVGWYDYPGTGYIKPVLSGNSNGWKRFRCTIRIPDSILASNHFYPNTAITLYRFTFITDSIETNKDGLMFDDFKFYDIAESVTDPYASNNLITVYPTPAQSTLRVSYAQPMHQPQIRITNSLGQTMRTMNNYTATDIDITELPNGVYMLQCADDKVCASKRFVVSR